MKLFTVTSALSSGSGSEILKRDIGLFCCFFQTIFLGALSTKNYFVLGAQGRHLFELSEISVLTGLKRTEKEID